MRTNPVDDHPGHVVESWNLLSLHLSQLVQRGLTLFCFDAFENSGVLDVQVLSTLEGVVEHLSLIIVKNYF